MPRTSKDRRGYDADGRRARALLRRDDILEHGRALLLEHGYAATTIAAIASASSVSPETVYKAFGGKPGIVKAIFDRSLLGSAGSPANERSDAAQLAAVDARSLFARFGELSAEVAPLTAPLMRLIRDAAAGGDAAMSALLKDVERQRYERMHHNAEVMRIRGLLPPNRSTDYVADVMWTYTADDVFHNLVESRGWTLSAYSHFISNALASSIL